MDDGFTPGNDDYSPVNLECDQDEKKEGLFRIIFDALV